MNSVRVGKLKVTAAPLPRLRAEVQRLELEAAALQASADQLLLEAGTRLSDVGLALVSRAEEWRTANPAAGRQLATARRVMARVEELAAPREEAKPRFAVFGRRRQQEPPAVQAERALREKELRTALTRLGRTHGHALDNLGVTRQEAIDMEEQATADLARARRLQRSAIALATEAENRDRAVRELGFDAPLEAAQLQKSAPGARDSPLQLRAGEVLYLAETGELARDRGVATAEAGAGGEQLPLSVTGIPFAVGARRARALPRESLSMLGPGTFVVTNQRLGFVGKLKSFSFPVTDLVRLDRYDDGLTLLREGRDNADAVITGGAGRIAFYINWVLMKAVEKS
ncbi:MAG: hypothetical protein NVSMB17_00760 [Candidatus Dormibacteria bacterium]